MPVENERKYILSFSSRCEERCHAVATNSWDVRQGYLSGDGPTSVRVRRMRQGDKTSYYLTVKHRIDGTCWEIENTIEQRDFEALWKSTVSRVKKTRYKVYGWDVDFFYEDDKRYFALAEIEMPEGQESPKEIPKVISENIIYVVSKDDNRFSSRKLSSRTFAQKVFSTVSTTRNK